MWSISFLVPFRMFSEWNAVIRWIKKSETLVLTLFGLSIVRQDNKIQCSFIFFTEWNSFILRLCDFGPFRVPQGRLKKKKEISDCCSKPLPKVPNKQTQSIWQFLKSQFVKWHSFNKAPVKSTYKVVGSQCFCNHLIEKITKSEWITFLKSASWTFALERFAWRKFALVKMAFWNKAKHIENKNLLWKIPVINR
jgi:hypothetical protein